MDDTQENPYVTSLASHLRSSARLWAAALVLLTTLLGVGVSPAHAAAVCTTSGNVVTCTYSFTGAAETFTVPAGVSSVHVVARGAAGGTGSQNRAGESLGGRGAEVSADLAVSPNQDLVLVVGGAPAAGDCYPDVRCIGGFNGGGTSYFGGGGGGASDVRVGGNGLAQRVLIAAGGGGGGESFFCGSTLVAGGNGGDAGSAGSAGQGCQGISGGAGGQPGSQAAGGAGGAPAGGNGTLGAGGNGGGDTGGGGGGGYYGGGGGGDLDLTPDFRELTAAGGGGGGSNLVPNSGQSGTTTQPAAIIVTYTLPAPPDSTPPVITPTVNGTLGDNGWYVSDVAVSWTVVDAESAVTGQSGCGAQSITNDTAGVTLTCSATSAGGTGRQTVTIKRDATAPTIVGAPSPAPNGNGWNNGDVTVTFTCGDNLSGVASCGPDQTLTSDGANQAATGTVTDLAGNDAATTVSGIDIDKTAPGVTIAAPAAATYFLNQAVAADYSCGDGGSGVASCTGTVADGASIDTGSLGAKTFTVNAVDNAGNPGTASVSYQVIPYFPRTGFLDSFNRANGNVGGNWDGFTLSAFYKIAGNKLDVQAGGLLVWKPTSFGTSQEAFVTLSTIDTASASQGLLLKVQSGNILNSGAISVVYDAKAKAVRVSTLRLGQGGAWTPYANQPATFANGDQLGARVGADGSVTIYKNGTMISTVTLNATDQAFFNSKGGKIGLWSVGAPRAVFDDFGGGDVTL